MMNKIMSLAFLSGCVFIATFSKMLTVNFLFMSFHRNFPLTLMVIFFISTFLSQYFVCIFVILVLTVIFLLCFFLSQYFVKI